MWASFCDYVIQCWIFLIFFKLRYSLFFNFSCSLLPLQVEGKHLKQVRKLSASTYKTKDGRSRRGFSQKSRESLSSSWYHLWQSVLFMNENVWSKRWSEDLSQIATKFFFSKKEQLDKNLVERCSSTAQCWIMHCRIYQMTEWAKYMAELQRKVGTPSDWLLVTVFHFCVFSFIQWLSIALTTLNFKFCSVNWFICGCVSKELRGILRGCFFPFSQLL